MTHYWIINFRFQTLDVKIERNIFNHKLKLDFILCHNKSDSLI